MKSYIWALPTRIFHWLLAIGFVAVCIFAESDENRNLHFAFGAFVGTLILFRLVYGLFGPKYSNFRDFPIGPKNQVEFARTFFEKTKVYKGHNPMASIVMLSIFIVGLVCSISGYLIYASESNVLSLSIDKDFFEGVHKITAILFLLLVVFHLLGVVLDLIFHTKNGTFLSIFNGYKNVETKNVKFNNSHKFFSIVWFIVPFIFFYLAYGLQTNKQENDKQNLEKIGHHKSENDDD